MEDGERIRWKNGWTEIEERRVQWEIEDEDEDQEWLKIEERRMKVEEWFTWFKGFAKSRGNSEKKRANVSEGVIELRSHDGLQRQPQSSWKYVSGDSSKELPLVFSRKWEYLL
jgi:hypothetical protein